MIKGDNKAKDLLKLKKFGEVQASNQGSYLGKRIFFDPALDNKLNRRDRRKTGAFNFVQEGTFIKRGDILRKQQVIEEHEMMKTSSSNEFKDDINKDGMQAEEEVKGEKKIDLRKTANLRT